ncbi:hypothetical protein [Paenibacillus spongiae]|uniref:Uncharacterized protein n=1 Tax=Paenibacillus spongiae TaxID=2909671 RepID=A0ABY5S433_9BACL|nr:hypothetical protein [Paenibacillus spongiae]UVI28340.1 hypothetical protein L1F29_23200 [Paenibacillus spongiae]
MPRKILRSQSSQYPFKVILNQTRVETLHGRGTIIDRTNEWIFVKLDRNKSTIKTSIFIVELLETA